MFWNTKFRWIIGVVFGFIFVVGLSRCSPIAPNLSKGDYQKNPRFAHSPPASTSSRVYVLRYSSQLVNAYDKDKFESTSEGKTGNVQMDGTSEVIKFSENSEDNKRRDQFLKFKKSGKTEIEISNSDPIRIPVSVQGIFALDTFPVEKYFDIFDPADILFFSIYSERIENFDSIVTELNPASEVGNSWVLEISKGTLKSADEELIQRFLHRLESMHFVLGWKN